MFCTVHYFKEQTYFLLVTKQLEKIIRLQSTGLGFLGLGGVF